MRLISNIKLEVMRGPHAGQMGDRGSCMVWACEGGIPNWLWNGTIVGVEQVINTLCFSSGSFVLWVCVNYRFWSCCLVASVDVGMPVWSALLRCS